VELAVLIVATIASIITGVVGLYLQHRNNQHFAEQNRLTVAEAGGSLAVTRRLPGWPLLVTGAMVLSVWAAVGYDYYDRYHPSTADSESKWNSYPLKNVMGKHFVRETVPLDGFAYIDSSFEDVTLTYEGTAPTRLYGIAYPGTKGSTRIRTNNWVVAQTLSIAAQLNSAGGCTTVFSKTDH